MGRIFNGVLCVIRCVFHFVACFLSCVFRIFLRFFCSVFSLRFAGSKCEHTRCKQEVNYFFHGAVFLGVG